MPFVPVLALFVLLFSTHISATELEPHSVKKVANNTYVIHGPLGQPNKKNKGFMNNPGFVVTKTGAVVIDPGSSVYVGRMLLAQIRTITKKPVTHVLNTHIHGDHWLGNQAFSEAFPDVVIMAHPDMIQLARAGSAEQWISIMSKATDGETDGTQAVIPEQAINDKQVLTIGGMRFRIHAPQKAHSFTDIMIEVIEESVVFLGDNVLYKRLPRMSDGTFKGNAIACQLAIDLNAKTYVPGHGPSGGKNVITPFMDYLNIIYREVGKNYEAGMTDFGMKPNVIAKLQDYVNWSDFKEQVGKHISLALLEYEADSF